MSDDPVFPGYPYGLIEADRLARVSHDEAAAKRTRLQSAFGKDWERVEKRLHTRDAHDILDS
ncbi:MAG: hypothetical protein ABEI52_12245, partial [Halobacteriaceae archaeon]